MTTTGEKLKMGSLLAASALTSESLHQWHFVYCSSTGIALTGANGAAHAVLENLAAADAPCELALMGITKVKAGGSITKGDWIKSDSLGRAVTASAADRLAGYALGWATEGGSTNELVRIYFIPNATAMTGSETKTSGALTVGVPTTYLSVTSAVAFTLADGEYVGQRKRIVCTVAATSPAGTLTINDAYGTEPTSWVFNAVGQGIELEWTSTGWKLTRLMQIGSEVLTASQTANPLCIMHTMVIDGTIDFIQGAGIIAGQQSIWFATGTNGTPVGTVSGLFYDEDGSADGIDLNMNAAGDQAVLMWDGSRWLASTLVSTTVTT